ncbi:histone PARylation factor 1-like [Manduca sexta]|uniref:PBZ-type domain-containing protein n=1 Tax=Manduca sexta TaxID=7130 RepID=A0A921ZL70_MANSE|nr:histone PARylation factor 1-like [Manduca sexta]KAG6459826.1 hypothetical protein O3G_MSEX011638 [Manduca sexta]KAG6459827.1 hypothetical protein O3G_MSEX011638 [Manduca sexta]
MSDESSAYNEDPRKACKYGSKCYQKNPNHHSTYKHPPEIEKNVTKKRIENRFQPYSRETKKDKSDKEEIEEKVTIDPPQKVTDKITDESSVDTSKKIVLPKDIIYYESSDHSVLKELFLVDMPDDFFKFYECLNSDGAIEKTLASVNLELIGPYELLLGKLPKLDDKELYLVHWRFFYDPPEFQAVLKKKDSEYHIGYFRDDPNEKPAFVGSNDSAKDCRITILADNLFGAVFQYLRNAKPGTTPHLAMKFNTIMSKLKKYCENENNFSIDVFNTKKRKAAQVANTLHHAGITAKYDKKTKLGYRPLVETDENLKKIFAKLKDAKTKEAKDEAFSELQPVINYASIAVDEYDFGTALELGIDLFCSGLKELEHNALCNLSTAYSLLDRKTFIKIIEAHLKYRRKGPNMSILAGEM